MIASSSATAPALLSGSLRLPHLGLCTQLGQPLSHGHSAMSVRASAARLSKASNPRFASPMPPG